jgi:hypothetical protein
MQCGALRTALLCLEYAGEGCLLILHVNQSQFSRLGNSFFEMFNFNYSYISSWIRHAVFEKIKSLTEVVDDSLCGIVSWAPSDKRSESKLEVSGSRSKAAQLKSIAKFGCSGMMGLCRFFGIGIKKKAKEERRVGEG